MRPHLYILDDKGEPLALPNDGIDDLTQERCESLTKWGEFMQKAELHVADEKVDGIRISTVFLGLDHSFGVGPAILWETMCFCEGPTDGHPLDQTMMRCSGSREQAEAMHKRMVEKVRNYNNEKNNV